MNKSGGTMLSNTSCYPCYYVTVLVLFHYYQSKSKHAFILSKADALRIVPFILFCVFLLHYSVAKQRRKKLF